MGSRVRVSSRNFQDVIMKALEDTRTLTNEALKAAIDQTAKQTVSKTKENAPTKTGAYKRAWTSKITVKSGRGRYGRTVYCKAPHYRLTHLLQNGHGGPRAAKAYPHIPSDEETEELFARNLESEMEKQ